jgi:sirohydrochlorin ferrochelatase
VAPTLIAVAHGTRDPAGPRSIEALLDRVRALRPGLRVQVAYVELVSPGLTEVLDRHRGEAVVVPLLLGTGYHLVHDVARVAAPRPVAPALGPHGNLVRALADRLRETPSNDGGPIVLAAAGSSDPRSRADAETVARMLSARLARPVQVAHPPEVRGTVAALRAAGQRHVAVATYLLAPGRFAADVARCGADAVSAPLGAHEAVARLILRRYDAARTGVDVVALQPV